MLARPCWPVAACALGNASGRGPTRQRRRYYVLRGQFTPADRDALARIAGELMPGAIVDTSELRAFERRLGEPKLLARLMLSLCVLAIVLTMAGIFATVSHAVTSPMVLASAALLLAVALSASLLPALRAGRDDPARTLREGA